MNDKKRNDLLDALEKYNLIIYDNLNNEIDILATEYVKAGIIPENKYEDAQHIAFAVFYDFDILLSWNFKHLANINKQNLVNELNNKLGNQKQIFLLNPMEVCYDKQS